MDFLIWKFLHIAAAIVFLGNITTGVFWAEHAHRTRDFRAIALVFDGIIRSDNWFTRPGVIVLIATGVVAAIQAKYPILGTGWIIWAIVLLSISGIAFGAKLVPLQRKIFQLTNAGDAGDENRAAYLSLYRQWQVWGLIALLAPIVAACIMVLKPALPAFQAN